MFDRDETRDAVDKIGCGRESGCAELAYAFIVMLDPQQQLTLLSSGDRAVKA